MMNRTITLALLTAALVLAACSSEKVEVLKSPCVGIEGSPCGPKRPVNGPLNQWQPHVETPDNV